MKLRRSGWHDLRISLVVIGGAIILGALTFVLLLSAERHSVRADVIYPATPASSPGPWVAPDLLQELDVVSDDATVRLIAVLCPPETMVNPLTMITETLRSAAGRQRYINMQQQRYQSAKSQLQPLLTAAAAEGGLVETRDLWVVNALALDVRPAVARALLRSSAIAEIHPDRYIRYLDPGSQGARDDALLSTVDDELWGLSAIQAPRTWQTFAVTGTGATVAVMDTGIDWQHSELYHNYRGNLGKGVFDHGGAWYDAVNGGSYPYDDHGHGTHVVGSAVGATTGVAPGAGWMGVKVLNGDGYGYDSWILSGFQWLLAPNGDASLAPDVVNSSWSSTDRQSTVFLEAIRMLMQAGIFPVFAAGNEGPTVSSVGSPASNPGVFAVGASDPDGEVAVFSGRGPSPWDDVKPDVVAPGVHILSSVPGGIYAEKNGTSMATPHVAGLGALMRSVSPTVSVAAMARVITETARPITTSLPSDDSGWGEIDAYAAILALTEPALITGVVTDRYGTPLANARITAWPGDVVPGAGAGLQVVTDAEGAYALALTEGRYTVRAEAFGHETETVQRVNAVSGMSSELNFALTRYPTGSVTGKLTLQSTGQVPSEPLLVSALGTPVQSYAVDGNYALTLPQGHHTLEVRGLGLRVVTETVAVLGGEQTVLDFSLVAAPKLLLVDDAAWYYGSQTAYWTDALDALRYSYDQLRIKDLGADLPLSTTLAAYDIVLWSSPSGSPGLVRAGSVLSDYLGAGGRLLLSGQDVAYVDGGGAVLRGAPEPYLVELMGAQYVADGGVPTAVAGMGPFDGYQVGLTGGTGADNQISADVVAVSDPELASQLWVYDEGGYAGVGAETCVPYRSLFFSFGYEAIAAETDRLAVLQRSINWLTRDPLDAGLTVVPVTAPTLIGVPGESVTHVVKVRHIGYAGVDETVHIAVSGANWKTTVSADAFELAPCTSALVTVTATIPAYAQVNVADTIEIAATSDHVRVPVKAALTSKTPASLLLVDDDRWYPMEEAYRAALDTAGIAYDLWDTRSGQGGRPSLTSPPLETLMNYPIVVWFTGYDWYAPIEGEEVDRLEDYLMRGGHLLLTSQDFVYHHQDDALTGMLGAMLADWGTQAEYAAGVSAHPVGQAWGPVTLDYPFPNWSHALEPHPDAVPVVRGQEGQPIAISTGVPSFAGAQTLFYAFPLEALPLTARSQALANGIGWLSPLGGSEWRVTPRTAAVGDTVAFELILRNEALQAMAVEARHPLPPGFALQPASLPADLTYEIGSRELVWEGSVLPATPTSIAWDATWVGGAAPASPTVTLSLPAWDLKFVREAPFYGAGLDLAESRWQITPLPSVRTTEPLTLTYYIHNTGIGSPMDATLSFWMMAGLGPITATQPLTQGISLAGWDGALLPNESRAIEIAVQGGVWQRQVRIDALLTDSAGHRWEDALWLTFDPWRSHMPVIELTR